MTDETIYDVYWEGPYEWKDCQAQVRECHVLYQIYGAHHLYGRDVLLYIGSSSRGVEKRLKDHEEWVEDEYETVHVRLGSVDKFSTWEEWDEDGDYDKADAKLVEQIEALLIYSHAPAYNERNIGQIPRAEGIRIFNSGHLGHLLPEVSYKYVSWGQIKR